LNFEYISSKENKLIKSVRKLMTSTRERREQGVFVLEGLRLCADAALSGFAIKTAIISEKPEDSDRLTAVLESSEQVVKVPDSLFATLCDTVSPQGVLCVVKRPCDRSIESIESGKYIVLENTADPANLGAIARTAEALGVSGIIVSNVSCDPFSPKSQRASMGALLRLPIIESRDVVADIKVLKSKGFKVFASVVDQADRFVTEADFSGNVCVLIGNEANGLSAKIIAESDEKITIPMNGRAESLNAAAAATILMWEAVRRGGNGDC